MDSLQVEINRVLAQYTSNVNETVDKVLKSEAQEAKKILTQTSPASRGKYAKSWAVRKVKGNYVVYNKKPGLTHLLENGHDVVVNGKKVGTAPAQIHIKPVEEKIANEITQKLEAEL